MDHLSHPSRRSPRENSNRTKNNFRIRKLIDMPFPVRRFGDDFASSLGHFIDVRIHLFQYIGLLLFVEEWWIHLTSDRVSHLITAR